MSLQEAKGPPGQIIIFAVALKEYSTDLANPKRSDAGYRVKKGSKVRFLFQCILLPCQNLIPTNHSLHNSDRGNTLQKRYVYFFYLAHFPSAHMEGADLQELEIPKTKVKLIVILNKRYKSSPPIHQE